MADGLLHSLALDLTSKVMGVCITLDCHSFTEGADPNFWALGAGEREGALKELEAAGAMWRELREHVEADLKCPE